MKIVGLGVVGPGEADRYLERTLKEFQRLTDETIICLNTDGEKERSLIEKYGFWHYEDLREWGVHQPSIKTDLLQKVMKLQPDWILPLDADEVFTQDLTRMKLEALTEDKIACYFYIVNHWDDEDHYHKGLSFWNIRFFKPKVELGLQYLKKPLHCGLAPPYAYKYGTYVPFLLRHFGLMNPEDRQAKVERYRKYDPLAKHKSELYYEALSAKTRPAVYNQESLSGKIKTEVDKMVHQKKRT